MHADFLAVLFHPADKKDAVAGLRSPQLNKIAQLCFLKRNGFPNAEVLHGQLTLPFGAGCGGTVPFLLKFPNLVACFILEQTSFRRYAHDHREGKATAVGFVTAGQNFLAFEIDFFGRSGSFPCCIVSAAILEAPGNANDICV